MMFAEFSIDASQFAAAMSHRLRSLLWCVGGTKLQAIPGVTNQETIIDHVELGQGAGLSHGSVIGVQIKLPSSAPATVAATGAQAIFPLEITLKDPAKAQDPAHTDEIYKKLAVSLIADLTSASSTLCIANFRITLPLGSVALNSIPGIPAYLTQSRCGNLQLGHLNTLLSVSKPINSGVFLNAANARLFLRLQLVEPEPWVGDDFIRSWWEDFFSGSVAASDASSDFSLYIDGGLIGNGFAYMIDDNLEKGASAKNAQYSVKSLHRHSGRQARLHKRTHQKAACRYP